MSAFGIIGPYFFEEGRYIVTVTSAQNQEMLETLEVDAYDFSGTLQFQQDSATEHTARKSVDCVRAMCPGRVISHFCDIAWLVVSPDLTAPDCSFWGHFKAKVYVNKVIHLKG